MPPLFASASHSFHSWGALVYQMNFNANCICRELVEVDDIKPALVFVPPVPVKTCRAVGAGGAKFAWFAMLKTSQRNYALNVSEIRWIGLFLNNEKSMSWRPGPISVLRPPLPRRFAQVPATGAGGFALMPKS